MKEFILRNFVRKNILDLKPYSCARDEFKGSEGIFLDANENPFGVLNRYPDPRQTELKQQLALLTGRNVSEIFVGNGSDEVIDLAIRIFCNPGKDRIMVFPPTYGMYKICAEINEIETVEIPLNRDMQLNMPEINTFLNDEHVKIIFICSPNNPTGNLIRHEDIETILNSFACPVFIDEAYIDFAGSESFVNMIDKYPNLIVSQTFSKSRALASARVGIAYSQPEIIACYNKIKPPYNVSSLNQEAAIEALNSSREFTERKNTILAEKKKMRTELSKMPCVKHIYKSDANFFLVEFDNANKTYSKLIDQKIITRNRSSVIDNCIRITVGTPEENETLLNALKIMKNEK
ncbi:MAG: histidinol-phosphate transaminase [Prevotellaceae bacterium]|jgi:histidinol-phosphate aminotransferase|nr:histidinol-phosphate transaminase [Prevotellaceae bacterium]